MSNLDKDLAEMRRLGYGTNYGKYKLDHPGNNPAPARPEQSEDPAEKQVKISSGAFMLVCSFCGETFASDRASKLYCSTSCCRKTAKKRFKERSVKEPKEQSRICPICGQSFPVSSARIKYCGPECQRLAKIEATRQWRLRQKEARL